MNADDVLDFLVVGARAVQLGTVQFTHPEAVVKILDGLRQAVQDESCSSIEELVGTLKT